MPADGKDQGANATITRLLMRHRATLYAYIHSCLRNHADTEEVFQEMSVSIVSSFYKLSDSDGFLPWAREIARRQVLAFIRKSKRPMIYDADLVNELASVADRLDARGDSDDRAQALLDCLENLPAKSRQILQMRYNGSCSGVDQIAAYLGRSMAATYGLLKRIRLNLKTCVETRLKEEAQHG